MPLGLTPEEFTQLTSLVQPVPFAARDKFLHALVAELAVAGTRSPGAVMAIGQKLQLQFLGVSVVAAEDSD